MALRIGRKQDDTPTVPSTGPVETTPQESSSANEDWSDFSTPAETPATLPPTSQPDYATPAQPVPARKTPPPVWLLGLGAFVLVAGALGALQVLGPKPPPDDDMGAPALPMKPPPPRPDAPPKPLLAARPVPTKVMVKVPVRKSPTRVVMKQVPAGKAGIVPPGVSAPALAPESPGKPARMVPVHGAPTPIEPPKNLAASPGKHGLHTTVVVAKPAPILTPELKAQLKKLWNEGAAAKHKPKPDIAGARHAWQQILKLSPGHPGIQEAIDKLPKG